MAKAESLGIRRLESVHYYVHDLERSRRFYTEVMDFAEVGESSEELTTAGRQKSLAFLAGNCVVVCVEPRGEGPLGSAPQRHRRAALDRPRSRVGEGVRARQPPASEGSLRRSRALVAVWGTRAPGGPGCDAAEPRGRARGQLAN